MNAAPPIIERFTGTCEPFAEIDVASAAAWIQAIPFEAWPQQHPLNGELRPAMVRELDWHGFGAVTEPLVRQLMLQFPGCRAHNRLLSVVMPGHWIDSHADGQNPEWIARVHIPLTSNERATFLCGLESHNLKVGTAYLVNTEAEHSIRNAGETARVHLMFDVSREVGNGG